MQLEFGENPPAALELSPTVPLGELAGPVSVSLTVTVQVEGTPSATADGEQTTAVAVARAVAVRFSEPLLGAHPGAPLAPA